MTLDCGPGETVVALEVDSMEVALPTMRASELARSLPLAIGGFKGRGDRPSNDELDCSWTSPSWADGVATCACRVGYGDCCKSSGHVEKTYGGGEVGPGGGLGDGVGILAVEESRGG